MNGNRIEHEHEIRKKLFAHIVEYPGVTFSTLKKFYDLNESTLRYHLKYLERSERITHRLEVGQLHYYPSNNITGLTNTSVRNQEIKNLTTHQQKILNVIKQNPCITQTELMAKVHLKRHVLTYNLPKLIDMGMVRKFNHVRNVCYEYITEELLHNEILKVLTIKLLNNEIDEQTFLKLKNRLK